MTSRPLVPRIDPALSERVSIARVVCILGMIWVHVPGAALDGVGRAFDPLDLPATFRAFLVESVGRSSAALLSVVSGWLCARVLLGGRTARELVPARARAMLVPMLFWGLVTVALYAAMSLVRPTFLSSSGPLDASTVLRWIDSVAFVTSAPSGPTLHLSFMRDLFVCSCLAPALLWLLARWPGALIATLGLVYAFDLESALMLRPLVLFAFAIGLLLARRGAPVEAADPYLGRWAALALGCTALVMLANGGAFAGLDASLGTIGLDLRESVLYPLARLFGSLTVWAATARLVGTRVGRGVAAQMPWLFTTYCSHFLVLAVLWAGLLHPLGVSAATPGFTLWFVAAPLLSLLAGRAVVRVTLARWPPGGGAARPARRRRARSRRAAPGSGRRARGARHAGAGRGGGAGERAPVAARREPRAGHGL